MKTLIWLVIAVVVIGGGYYYWSNSDQGFDPTKPYAISGEFGGATSTPVDTHQSLSLKDLLSSSSAQKCTVKAGDVGVGAEGVVYVSSGQIRGDFTSDSAAGQVGTHLVVRDGQTYSWVDGFKNGLKAPVDTSSTNTSIGGVDVEAKFDYQCEPWTVDKTVFVLPLDITFSSNPSI